MIAYRIPAEAIGRGPSCGGEEMRVTSRMTDITPATARRAEPGPFPGLSRRPQRIGARRRMRCTAGRRDAPVPGAFGRFGNTAGCRTAAAAAVVRPGIAGHTVG
ncbi:hypothetical protein SCWH03_18950 [Streptomyces pacificus]|uniref:Uncharacterized protein n=1 Tax=Streptomyces pacificus TaxID=2705029 RepID=A0A6A0AUU0_9ACTN|nr:hypothetical protein SCWH03_18950 [Streptomyces pacificus]